MSNVPSREQLVCSAVQAIYPSLGLDCSEALATTNDPSPQANTTAKASPKVVQSQQSFTKEELDAFKEELTKKLLKLRDPASYGKDIANGLRLELTNFIRDSKHSIAVDNILQIINGARLPLLLNHPLITAVWNEPRWTEDGEGDWKKDKQGEYIIDRHGGLDIGASKDIPVYAIEDGRVFFADDDPDSTKWGWGTHILIYHSNEDVSTLYAHLNKRYVDKNESGINGRKKELGESIKKGQIIGTVGKTGTLAKGVHLHFAIFKGMSWTSTSVEPLTFPWNSK